MKLAHALIAKSIVETVLVGALAVGFYVYAFPPTYHGWGEVLPDGIAGWAINAADPYERLEVQLFVDDKFVAATTANQSRPDVVAAGWARDEWHGYKFGVPTLSSGFHTARIYALHNANQKRRTLQLLGDSIYFTLNENGKIETRRKPDDER